MDKFIILIPAIIQSAFTIALLLTIAKIKFERRRMYIITAIFSLVLLTINVIIFYNTGLLEFEKYNLFTLFLPQAIYVSIISKRRLLSSIVASLSTYLAIYAVQLVKTVFTARTELLIFDYLHIFTFPIIAVYFRKIYYQLHNEIEQTLPKLLYYLLIFEIILCMEFFAYAVMINATTAYVLRLEIFIVATTSIYFVAVAIMYFMIEQYKKHLVKENDAIILKQSLYSMEEIIKIREIKEKQLRIVRHDLRHVLLNINNLLKNQEYDEVNKITKDYIKAIDSTSTKRFSSIPMIDTLIEYYSVICQENNVDFKTNFVNFEEAIKIPVSELSIFISNCLENAFNATTKLEENRYISIIFKNNKGRLILQIENSYNGEIELDKDNKPTSSNIGHGVGTNSIHWFAQRNNLSINYNITEDTFTMNVLFEENHE